MKKFRLGIVATILFLAVATCIFCVDQIAMQAIDRELAVEQMDIQGGNKYNDARNIAESFFNATYTISGIAYITSILIITKENEK